MKWYSVKKYKPVSGRIYFVVDTYGILWLARYFADCEWHEEEYNGTILYITHFCVPDPVEIEE